MACHSCGPGDLGLLMRIDQRGVGPGEPGHDIVYAHSVVFFCGRCGGAEIEILEHDCFDPEDVSDRYSWYRLGPPDAQRLVDALSACPAPLSAECRCAVHEALRGGCRRLGAARGSGRVQTVSLEKIGLGFTSP